MNKFNVFHLKAMIDKKYSVREINSQEAVREMEHADVW